MAEDYIGSASGPIDDTTVNANGAGNLAAMIGGLFSGLSQALQDGLNIAVQLFGIAPASASSYPVLNSKGQLIGYTTLPQVGLMPMARALIQTGAKLDAISGRISNAQGKEAGAIMMDSATTGGPIMIGPISVYDLTQNLTVTTPEGPVTVGMISPSVGGLLTSIDGFAMQQPSVRYWRPSACNTRGLPCLDATNQWNLFNSGGNTPAYLHASKIMGKDGIYDLMTGLRVVPPQGAGYPAPQGFNVGGTSNFQKTNVAIGWTSAARSFLWGYYGGDFFNVLDPSTNASPVIAGYAAIKGWNGSQQVSTDGYPASDWKGATPNASNPGINTTVAGKMFYSKRTNNLGITGPPPGSDPGRGADGGAANF